ncbi:alpha/beta hydrolase [Candidatus Marimicrobium litorale]|uniref:Alpha/beta hydrolase n=1 Tax=Candidatus Marimicrobium litorale TaxID=2518991 RepID=A0ABT3T794_9GAMM|nr:alpha/beta hydrolase [Candidatus Marimicrobium litorale]MCX2978148.1 alpha/beta hydrolase [Candidatus Marimicrobium litorale]
MSLAGIYLFLALFSAFSTFAAIVQARKIFYLTPVYFLCAWLCGELALLHIIWQVALTAVVAFFGGLSDPLVQTGLWVFAASWLGMVYLHCQALDTAGRLRPALGKGLGEDYRQDIPQERRQHLSDTISSSNWLRPFHFSRSGVQEHNNIAYGDAGKRNLLDIYQPQEEREGGFPVLLQVHGGAWIIGEKEQQGKPLMYHMAQRGWICVAINYRLSPKAVFPDHIIDVKKAIAWIRQNIHEYGGNPDFIAITGGSAGGHLSSLASLTPNRREWQPGFEDIDTTVQAAVPIYGVYDFLDRNNIRSGMSMESLLSDKVMQCTPTEKREAWEAASPISHVSDEAPPMFVIQGTHDSLVWVEEARAFVSALKAATRESVVYAELPGAQHAFEIFHSVRTEHTVNGVADFLEWSHARWLSPE